MVEGSWRFPHNNYTSEHGLNTSDMEMFKRDPVSSLAREICQNSLDAAYGEFPVIVEFKPFHISRDEIPGIKALTQQINACYEYKKGSPQEGPALTALKKNINRQTIACLRISDFHTTGIEGANGINPGTPFYNLTRGSGISDKGGSSGGSKGIGKFASFVASSTNTVFYSTKAKDNSCGCIGISQLRSTPIPGADPNLLTLGVGYFAQDQKNSPIEEELYLDKNFSRGPKEYGTDVYIIGFNDQAGWQNDIIAKVLDSFMVALVKGELQVVVEDTIVNKDTIKEIIFSNSFQNERPQTEYREIRAQYELLQVDDSVTVKDLEICDKDNLVTVYLKQYSQSEEKNATMRCVMVRYPYMKITTIKPGPVLPFSALCVIHENNLNERLRAIENPQHTNWELKRLSDFPEERRNTRKMKNELEDTVKEFIRETLRENSGESTDIEGAGEFLPSQEEGMGNNKDKIYKDEGQVQVYNLHEVKQKTPKTQKIGEAGESYEFSTGDPDSEGEIGRQPQQGENHNSNPEPKPEPTEDGNIDSGNSSVLKRVPLSGMRYRTIVTDKAHGKYDCIFRSEYDEDNCELAIRLCGESADKYPMDILTASINGIDCNIQDGKITGLKIKKGETYKISYLVDSDEMFASEVILSAYR